MKFRNAQKIEVDMCSFHAAINRKVRLCVNQDDNNNGKNGGRENYLEATQTHQVEVYQSD
jgi:hypothetical protein